MNIYSEYATEEARTAIGVRLADEELKKFAFEFCTAFNLRAINITSSSHGNGIKLVTQSGLPAGHIYTQRMYSRKADERKTSFFYTNPRIVTKEKGSMNSNRDTRDSTKISTLLSTMRRHDEIPNDEKILRGFCDGIFYAFNAAGAANRYGAPRFDIDSSLALDVTKAILGIDELTSSYKTMLESKYEDYLRKMEDYNATKSEQARFYKGCKMIAVLDNDSGKPAYLVGEVSYNTSGDERDKQIVFQSPLKRYTTLAESPVAADALMIRTFMENGTMTQYHADNELKLRHCDMYFKELDMAVGYTLRDEFFVLLPLTAPDA